jgi:hypothetical protein
MNQSIFDAIQRILPELRELGVEHLDVFGSVARGSETPQSDLDVVVHLGRAPELRRLVAIADALELAVGRKVDVTTPGALSQRPRLQRRVEHEAIRVA